MYCSPGISTFFPEYCGMSLSRSPAPDPEYPALRNDLFSV